MQQLKELSFGSTVGLAAKLGPIDIGMDPVAQRPRRAAVAGVWRLAACGWRLAAGGWRLAAGGCRKSIREKSFARPGIGRVAVTMSAKRNCKTQRPESARIVRVNTPPLAGPRISTDVGSWVSPTQTPDDTMVQALIILKRFGMATWSNRSSWRR